jgi:hypothetical protein
VAKKVSFSNEKLELVEIANYYSDSEQSFKMYYLNNNHALEERFFGYSREDLANELRSRIEELNHTSSLTLLATLEAAFRIDYLQRNYKKKRDPLSRSFRNLFKTKNSKASLEDDILEAWKSNAHGTSKIIGDLKGALKYRHWLAHGRYWTPKMGRQNYDYATVYELVETVLNSFPFEGVNA